MWIVLSWHKKGVDKNVHLNFLRYFFSLLYTNHTKNSFSCTTPTLLKSGNHWCWPDMKRLCRHILFEGNYTKCMVGAVPVRSRDITRGRPNSIILFLNESAMSWWDTRCCSVNHGFTWSCTDWWIYHPQITIAVWSGNPITRSTIQWCERNQIIFLYDGRIVIQWHRKIIPKFED